MWYTKKDTMAFFVVLLPNVHKTHSNHEKSQDKLELNDIKQENWPVLFKCVKIMKDEGKLKNCYRLEEAKEK